MRFELINICILNKSAGHNYCRVAIYRTFTQNIKSQLIFGTEITIKCIHILYVCRVIPTSVEALVGFFVENKITSKGIL